MTIGDIVPKVTVYQDVAGYQGVTNYGRVIAYLIADKRYTALQGTQVAGFKRWPGGVDVCCIGDKCELIPS